MNKWIDERMNQEYLGAVQNTWWKNSNSISIKLREENFTEHFWVDYQH